MRQDGWGVASQEDRDARSRRTRELFERIETVEEETERRRLLAEIVLLNRRVAEAVAARYARKGLSREDLVQVAYEGLVKAVHRFDPAARHDLLTYAVPLIRGELRRHFRDRGWLVRPPRRVQEMQARINDSRERLEQRNNSSPSVEEIARELSQHPDECREALSARGCFAAASLDRELPEAGNTLGDSIADPREPQEREAAEARVMLAPAMARLKERDRRILQLRYVDGLSQREVGKALGVTQAQVSKLIAAVLDRLRRDLGVRRPAPGPGG